MTQEKYFIGIDPIPVDASHAAIIKTHKDGTIEVVCDSRNVSQDEFNEKVKELSKYFNNEDQANRS